MGLVGIGGSRSCRLRNRPSDGGFWLGRTDCRAEPQTPVVTADHRVYEAIALNTRPPASVQGVVGTPNGVGQVFSGGVWGRKLTTRPASTSFWLTQTPSRARARVIELGSRSVSTASLNNVTRQVSLALGSVCTAPHRTQTPTWLPSKSHGTTPQR